MNSIRSIVKIPSNFFKVYPIISKSYKSDLKLSIIHIYGYNQYYKGSRNNNIPKRSFSTEVDLEKEIEEKLKKTIESEKILIFIKGTPEDPQCKYSAKMIEILNKYKLNDYAYINVFSHELLRKCVKNVSNWPTFPQLYIKGKLIGGSDVVDELHNTGELEKLF